MTPATHTKTAVVAIVGNPNTGKSTLFNELTGSRVVIGNYPGVTVDMELGRMDDEVSLVDLPGTYAMTAASPDEQIVMDALCGRVEGVGAPDAVICCVDATNLRRNLFFVSQVADTGVPVVVALNMWDSARQQGIAIDTAELARRLGVRVVPTVAVRGEGVEALRAAVHETLETRAVMKSVDWPEPVREAARSVHAASAANERVGEAEALRLLFDSESVIAPEWSGEPRETALAAARETLKSSGLDPLSAEATLRYRHVDRLLEGTVTRHEGRRGVTSAIDRILTHRVYGLAIFAAMMFGVFWTIYIAAQPAMDGIDWFFGGLGDRAGVLLEGTPMLESLVVDGLLAGVGGVVIFLPQILVLFFFIAVLETSGYMARAAFLMDKIFSWCGLSGKSFVPILSSFACAVPAILSTRTIEDRKARLLTILISPLMSCSARLPVYILLIGAFITPTWGATWSAVALFGMHALGLLVAVPLAWFFNKALIKGRPALFLLEMPPYRMPRWRLIWWRVTYAGKEFVTRAGTIILAFSVIIWALTFFPRPDSVKTDLAETVAVERGIAASQASALLSGELEPRLKSAYMEQSYMGRMGKAVQPVFALAGFDWKITVGVLAAFPAREVIISTLGIVYSLSDEQIADAEESRALRDRLAAATWPDGRPVYTPLVAISIMVFFAFCLQCASTVAVIIRETNWRWAVFAFVYMTGLAWLSAVGVYQIGSLI